MNEDTRKDAAVDIGQTRKRLLVMINGCNQYFLTKLIAFIISLISQQFSQIGCFHPDPKADIDQRQSFKIQ